MLCQHYAAQFSPLFSRFPIGMFNPFFSLHEDGLNIAQYISYDQITHLYEITMFVLSYSMVTPLVVFEYLALSEKYLPKAPLKGG